MTSVPSRDILESLAKRTGGALHRSLQLLLTRCQKQIYFYDKQLMTTRDIEDLLNQHGDSKR